MGHAHHQVIIEKLCRVELVDPNTTDMGRKVDDHIRAGLGEHPLHCFIITQVILAASWDKDLCGPSLLHLFHDERAKKTRASRNDNTAVFPEIGQRMISHIIRFLHSDRVVVVPRFCHCTALQYTHR